MQSHARLRKEGEEGGVCWTDVMGGWVEWGGVRWGVGEVLVGLWNGVG